MLAQANRRTNFNNQDLVEVSNQSNENNLKKTNISLYIMIPIVLLFIILIIGVIAYLFKSRKAYKLKKITELE
jgi:uncharacterized membrane protein YvbJ